MTTIEVTTADILQGKRDNCRNCPIALATQRVVNCLVEVVYRQMSLNGTHIDLPDEVNGFIFDFDMGRAVGPFKFDLDIPQEYLRWPSPTSPSPVSSSPASSVA